MTQLPINFCQKYCVLFMVIFSIEGHQEKSLEGHLYTFAWLVEQELVLKVGSRMLEAHLYALLHERARLE